MTEIHPLLMTFYEIDPNLSLAETFVLLVTPFWIGIQAFPPLLVSEDMAKAEHSLFDILYSNPYQEATPLVTIQNFAPSDAFRRYA
jgi:hypothetical protein